MASEKQTRPVINVKDLSRIARSHNPGLNLDPPNQNPASGPSLYPFLPGRVVIDPARDETPITETLEPNEGSSGDADDAV
jgi:hypothetical protein